MSDQRILEASKDWKVPESRSKEQIWDALEEQIKKDTGRDDNVRRPYLWVAAASVAIILGSALFFLFFQNAVIETGLAEIKTIELPDGSQVVLNASSQLSYVTSSFEQSRQLNLEGEAYFDVKPGSSFTVDLNGVEVVVLGTSFNIYSREETKEVKCLSGKVKVSGESHEVILDPGFSVVALEGQLDTIASSFDLANAISWQEGKFLFENTPMARVVRELEIQYGISVEAGRWEDRFYTGYFENTDIELAAKQVFSPMGYSYEIQDKKIVIR